MVCQAFVRPAFTTRSASAQAAGRTHSLDKTAKIDGVLLGIKGQYLILDTGVLNIRKFGGYIVSFCF